MTVRNKLNRLLFVLLMVAALGASAFGQQTALTQTTITQSMPNTRGLRVFVASATNILPPQLPTTAGGLGSASSGTYTFLYIDRELMQVNTVAGLVIFVERGVQGTAVTPHNSGATVTVVSGSQLVNASGQVQGACTSSINPPVVPFINPADGSTWTCPAVGPYINTWVQTGILPGGSFTPSDNTLPGTSTAFVCHARYNFAVDGGAVSTITPKVGCTIPINAVITKVVVYCNTTTVGSTGNISLGLSAGGAGTAALWGATARASCSTGTFFDGVPVAGATASLANATYIHTSAAGAVTFTIATNALTAGIVEADVFYYVLQA